MPLHGASTTTQFASRGPACIERSSRSTVAFDASAATTRTHESPRRAHVSRTSAALRSWSSTEMISPRSPISSARCAVLPPGAAQRSRVMPLGGGAASHATHCAPMSCTLKAPWANPGSADTSPAPASTIKEPSRGGIPSAMVAPADRSDAESSAGLARSRLTRRARGGRCCVASAHASTSSNLFPNCSCSSRSSHSGVEVRIASAPSSETLALAVGCASESRRRTRVRSTPFTKRR